MTEKVIAAVPAYNAGEHLLALAQQLDAEPFDDVYILDDGSTDGSVARLAARYPHFKIIVGKKNKGAGANRNRIMSAVHDGIILFVDADMDLRGKAVDHIKAQLHDNSIGILGGLILNKSLKPMEWNYGHEMHPSRDVWFSQTCEAIRRPDISVDYRQELVQKLHAADADFHWAYPELLPLKQREVDWVAEGLFAIRAHTFKIIGGYDEKMRYHEGQDLARRVRDASLKVIFTPELTAVHKEIDVRGNRRTNDFYESQFYFFKKHWGMSREVYEHLYPTPPQPTS